MINQSIPKKPSLKWGVLGTGWISTAFVGDLLLPRPEAAAEHSVVAIGSSSISKASKFVADVWKDSSAAKPQLYDTYTSVYEDPNVDIVYVGTPHSMHKRNCLDAISAGKNVLCEKPFAINAAEAEEVIAAARTKGVYIMEAVWTRFVPLMQSLMDHIHVRRTIGTVQRMFVDFSLAMNLDQLPANSRLKDPALGAGALLDIGIYDLTYASMVLGGGLTGDQHPKHHVKSSLSVVDGSDRAGVVVLKYPQLTGGDSMAICTFTLSHKGGPEFCTIEGTEGTIVISGIATSVPSKLYIRRKARPRNGVQEDSGHEEEVYKFEHPGLGFHFEADAVAVDISNGLRENEAVMPVAETVRLLKLMDGIRRSNGLVYPQDV